MILYINMKYAKVHVESRDSLKKRKWIRKQSMLRKYLLSYIIVFALPMLLLVFYFYPQTAAIIQKTANDNASAVLNQTVRNIDLQLGTFGNYPDAIHRNNLITLQLFLDENSHHTKEIMTEMEKLYGYNSFVEKAILYNKHSGSFYSFPGSYSGQTFNNPGSTFYYPEWKKEDMLFDLTQVDEMVMRPAEPIKEKGQWRSTYDAVTIMMSVPYRNLNAYGVLMLVIPEENFFLDVAVDTPHHMFVLGEDGGLIATSNGAKEVDTSQMRSWNAGERVTVNGEKYVVNLQESSLHGITVLSLTSLQEVLQDLSHLQVMTFLMILLILAVEVGLIYLFMKTNYEPIRRLRMQALASVDSIPEQGLNEFETVSYAFNSLHNENMELVNQTLRNRNRSKENLLIQLLNGTFSEVGKLAERTQERDVHLRGQVCCVTVFAKDRNMISLLTLIKESFDLDDSMSSPYCYGIGGMRHEDLVLIFTFDSEEELKPFLYRLYKLESNCRIGIGTIEEASMMNYSYTHSLAALETAILNQTQQIVAYEAIDVENADMLQRLFDSIHSLEITIVRGDAQKFQLILQKLIEQMKTKINRMAILKMVYINTHNILAKELNKRGQKEPYCYALSEKEMNLLDLGSKLDVMGRALSADMLQNKQINNGVVDIIIVLQYVDNHYDEESMSLQRLADQFNLSYSNFSHFFKKKTGENFAAYLEKLRIGHAKKLLIETNRPIKEIATKVGYGNANSFTRSFKKSMSETPGEYRKNKKKHE